MESDDKALVLFSGGQDSATCLAWALANFGSVETVGFEYGQRHAVELECRERVRARMGELKSKWRGRLGPDHLLAIPVLGELSDTALTGKAEIALRADGLPNTFVPGRNLLFFVLAAALATRRGAGHLVGGMCETDYSGYPDCRDATIRALEAAINLGVPGPFALDTPLMRFDKADTWRLAEQLGGAALVELIRAETHTCYLGERGTLRDWGYGCGACPACELRAAGYARYRSGSSSSLGSTTIPVQ